MVASIKGLDDARVDAYVAQHAQKKANELQQEVLVVAQGQGKRLKLTTVPTEEKDKFKDRIVTAVAPQQPARKKVAAAKERTPRGPSAGVRLRKLILQHPDCTKETLAELAKKDGMDVSQATINMVMYEHRQTMVALQELGMLDGSKK